MSAKLGDTTKRTHTIMFVFRCDLKDGSEPSLPNPTSGRYQVGVKWVKLEDLPSVRLLPPIADQLLEALRGAAGRDIFLMER